MVEIMGTMVGAAWAVFFGRDTILMPVWLDSWRRRHRHPAAPSAGHIVFEQIGGAGRGLVVYMDGQDGLLKRQQAVLGHVVLVVEGFIGLLMKQTHMRRCQYWGLWCEKQMGYPTAFARPQKDC
ncbi:hypothetical protein EYF80_002979 [Liparis tanakae]|uniref:Uncharacterized protein n=1 Tax=Liparis tanakae TaxID=230148 RepID=A0A4Z2J999_9TELE|nr:hypothetical protein EYF80_002979 [Liparis tanakae]